ncbi:MAG: hypothetical protein FWD64_05810 [Acidobacteriaceae bacterium]|nr:hypothetical protein [Acidobacteriaceae bacterium]
MLTLIVALLATLTAGAQENKKSDVPNSEIAFTYLSTRVPVGVGYVYTNGAVVAADAGKVWYPGFGVEWARGNRFAFVTNYTYARKSFAANMNDSLFTYTFGGRYTYRKNKSAIFGEALIGGARETMNGTGGISVSANYLAIQLGGGYDLSLSRNVALRMPQVQYQAVTSGQTNSQQLNMLQIGGGVVFRY